MGRYVWVVPLLAIFIASPAYAQAPVLNAERFGTGARPQQPDPGEARLQRERAELQQRERELQQQLQRDRIQQQRLQQEQVRQQQERRDRQAGQWQQLGDTFQSEMRRITDETEREEAEELAAEAARRERATQEELQALKKRLETMQSSAAQPAKAATSTAPAEANPFEKDAKLATGAKDPEANHAGEECSYFTKPLVREGGSGLNIYADGNTVCYGKRMYKCVNRHWTSVGRCDMYDNWQKHSAERLEN